MKNWFLFIVLVFCLCPLYADSSLMHSYYHEYKDIVRVVFVFDHATNYSAVMNSDDKELVLIIQNCHLNPSILPLTIDTTNTLLDSLRYKEEEKETIVHLKAKSPYYAEAFRLQKGVFKIVVDIYTHKDPLTEAEYQNRVLFYKSVGFDRKIKDIRRPVLGEPVGKKIELVPVTTPLPNSNTENVTEQTIYPAEVLELIYMRPNRTGYMSLDRLIEQAFTEYSVLEYATWVVIPQTNIGYRHYIKKDQLSIKIEVEELFSFHARLIREIAKEDVVQLHLTQLQKEIENLPKTSSVKNAETAKEYTLAMIKESLEIIPRVKLYLQNQKDLIEKEMNYKK